MNPIAARVGAYGLSAALAGGLIYFGFVYESDPDLLTMVSSVEVQLRMASVMPEKDKDGNPVAERAELLTAAGDYLDRIDRAQPDFPPAVDYRAYLAYLHKDFGEAAKLYERVRGLGDSTATQRDQALINQARMLRLRGEPEAAVKLLTDNQGSLSPEYQEIVQREIAGPVAAGDAAKPAAETAVDAPVVDPAQADPTEPAVPQNAGASKAENGGK